MVYTPLDVSNVPHRVTFLAQQLKKINIYFQIKISFSCSISIQKAKIFENITIARISSQSYCNHNGLTAL